MKSTRASIVVGAWCSIGVCSALLFLATMGCGGDLRGGYNPSEHYSPSGPRPDGGACAYYGGNPACGCVDQPYVLGVSITLESNGALNDLDVELFRQAEASASISAQPPAKGSAGASAYDVATLVNADGMVQSTFVFANPLVATSAGRHGRVQFTMPLAAGVSTLDVENWDSGALLIDLDLRGHVQLLCIDRPCLSLCQAPDGGVDSALAPAVDGGAIDGS